MTYWRNLHWHFNEGFPVLWFMHRWDLARTVIAYYLSLCRFAVCDRNCCQCDNDDIMNLYYGHLDEAEQ